MYSVQSTYLLSLSNVPGSQCHHPVLVEVNSVPSIVQLDASRPGAGVVVGDVLVAGGVDKAEAGVEAHAQGVQVK